MRERIRREIEETRILLRCVPPWVLSFVVMSFVTMNLMANKSIRGLPEWLALDSGMLVSWVSFLAMDVLVKRFGPKAATKITVVGVVFNLLACFMFFVCASVPGDWGASFEYASASDVVNASLDATFGGTWYVLLGSTVSIIVSSVVNNSMNYALGRLFGSRRDSFAVYAARSYISTLAGQFVDNLVFALMVSVNFFGWTTTQAVTCAVTGSLVECVFEVVFFPIGYHIAKKWEADDVGREYLDYVGE